jgi:hypothetical protein
MIRRLLFLLVPVLLAVAPPELGPDELAALSRREVVVRALLPEGTAAGAVGVIDLSCPPERAIDAILDLEARIGEISGLKSASVYERTPETLGVRWEVRVLTTTVAFHLRYAIERGAGRIRYALDPSRPNDLLSAEGAYEVSATPGGSRVVFRSTSDSGRNVPDWIKRWLAEDALTQQLEGIRRRAEAPR